jgi:hypothetical protein
MLESEDLEDPIEVRVQVVRSTPSRVRVWALDGSGSFVAERDNEPFARITAGDTNISKVPRRRTVVTAWPEHPVQMARADFEHYRDSDPLPEVTGS